jgi:trans-aconitate 2-methyltransferase
VAKWDPHQYLRFSEHRKRAALELLGRIPLDTADQVWDLGCGSGSVTAYLSSRWPEARITGLDSSPEMLAEAPDLPRVSWVEGTIEGWSASEVDIAYSNAVLHWIERHEVLLPRLVQSLRPGGVLAVQMPRNFDRAAHRVLSNLARSPQWSERVGHLARRSPVALPGWYYDLMAPVVSSIDIWETTYLQVLDGDDAVAEWMKGAAARPYLEALGSDAETFHAEYTVLVREHYPCRPDVRTLFPFRRLFMVAIR